MAYVKRGSIFVVALVVLMSLFGNARSYAYKGTAVPEPVKLSPRLESLFEKTKILCFGRYAIEVPQEAQLMPGNAELNSDIEIIVGGLETAKRRADEEFKKVKWEDDTAEITYQSAGAPVGSYYLPKDKPDASAAK